MPVKGLRFFGAMRKIVPKNKQLYGAQACRKYPKYQKIDYWNAQQMMSDVEQNSHTDDLFEADVSFQKCEVPGYGMGDSAVVVGIHRCACVLVMHPMLFPKLRDRKQCVQSSGEAT